MEIVDPVWALTSWLIESTEPGGWPEMAALECTSSAFGAATAVAPTSGAVGGAPLIGNGTEYGKLRTWLSGGEYIGSAG